MAKLKVENLLNDVLRLCKTRQITMAFDLMSQYARQFELKEEYDSIVAQREAYSKLIEKAQTVKHDSQVEEDFNTLMLQMYAQLQSLWLTIQNPDSKEDAPLKKYLDNFLNKRSDASLCSLFDVIRKARALDSEQRLMLHQVLMDDDVPEFMRCTILSAITLHLIEHFDAELLENIYTFTLDDQPEQIRWRAWVTMMMCAIVHPVKIELCDRICELYRFMAESEPELILSMQITLLQCSEAETIEDKVNKIFSKRGSQEEKSKFMFAVIQQGADLSYNTFRMVRHAPFFSNPSTTAHWLMPFSLEQDNIKAILEQNPQLKQMIQLLSKSMAQSDQDKYGAAMVLLGAEKHLTEQINDKFNEINIDFSKILSPSGEVLMRNYLHDLYRFFKLSAPESSYRVLPFKKNLDLGRLEWLAPALGNEKAMTILSKYLIDNEQWDMATVISARLVNINTTEDTLKQLAFAASMRKVRDIYLEGDPLIRCNKLYPGNVDTLIKLAAFYHRVGMLSGAEACLKEALKIDPKNEEILTGIGECCMDMNNPKGALEAYFQLDLLTEGNVKVQRMIALSSFMAQNFEVADKYIDILLSYRKPINADWALAGCVALKNGDLGRMSECFQHIGSYRNRVYGFDNHRKAMAMAGVKEQYITMGRDIIDSL